MNVRLDERKATAKAMPLKAGVPMVKSPKVPAVKAKVAYRVFDDVEHLADVIVRRFVGLEKSDPDAAEWMPMLQQFFDAVEYFERDQLYEQTKDLRRRTVGRTEHNTYATPLSRRVVSEQVSLLIGGFPNTGSVGSPEVYTKMLVEEIIVANPSAMALESVCRQLRRTKTFLPAIAEVLEVLGYRQSFWDDVRMMACRIEDELHDKQGIVIERAVEKKLIEQKAGGDERGIGRKVARS
jgi:hypothetical protein